MLDPAAHARLALAVVSQPALAAAYLLVLAADFPLGRVAASQPALAGDFPPGQVAASQLVLAGVYPRVRVVVSRPGRGAGYQMALILGGASLIPTTELRGPSSD